jgi:aspartate kinase
MKIFKFGGASVNSAAAIKNVANILKDYRAEKLIVVFSAMGKMTNALEEVAKAGFEKSTLLEEKIVRVEQFHFHIVGELFADPAIEIFADLRCVFRDLRNIAADPPGDFDKYYDSIVSLGEACSTAINSAYLKACGIDNIFVDAKTFIVTNSNFRDAAIDWNSTCEKINQVFNPDAETPENNPLFITQGFIGSTPDGIPTTLGREGSDFTASILAFCLNADEVVVWKDVDGLLNADPVYFEDPVKVDQLSYRETIELSFFGAKILHPKTIKPLQNKQIPLRIKSFFKPDQPGTIIHKSRESDHLLPFLILKKDQVLISFSTRDFSFITEENLQKLFGEFSRLNIKVNLMQNSAISFTVCVNNPGDKLKSLIDRLGHDFEIFYNDQLELLTIRHFTDEMLDKHLCNCEILLEQRSRRTIQVAYKRGD